MSEGKGAGEALADAVIALLRPIGGLNGIYEGVPIQAACPYALVEAGPERDWSHKTGVGREVRLAVVLRDQGERPARLRRLAADAEAALGGLGAADGWQLVTFDFVRSMIVAQSAGRWALTLDYRARMLAD